MNAMKFMFIIFGISILCVDTLCMCFPKMFIYENCFYLTYSFILAYIVYFVITINK